MLSLSKHKDFGLPMPDLDITVAGADERGVIANLLQLYAHDFSDFWTGLPDGELQGDGRFEDYWALDLYWREPDRTPLLFRIDGHPVGFALLNRFAHSGLPLDWSMAEFFIVRKPRRGGVGTQAARAVFSLYPGLWEAAVARKNVGALAFWRRAASGHPDVEDVDETDHQTSEWNGPVLRFRIKPGS